MHILRWLYAALALTIGGGALAAGDTSPPPETYSGVPVGFLEHTHGVWRGVQTCPNSNAATTVDLSLVALDRPDQIGGVFHSRHGFQIGDGPLRVRVDEKARTLHVELLNPFGSLNGSLDMQLSASGERFTQVNSTGQCTPIVFARQVDPHAAGPLGGPPVITRISELSATQRQHITISGHGFGTHPPIHGNSVVFAITNHSASPKEWNAGFAGDVPPNALTIAIHSWTDTEIVSDGFFTGYGPSLHLNPRDKLTFYVWNPGTLAGPAMFDVVVSESSTDPAPASRAPVSPAPASAEPTSCSSAQFINPPKSSMPFPHTISYVWDNGPHIFVVCQDGSISMSRLSSDSRTISLTLENYTTPNNGFATLAPDLPFVAQGPEQWIAIGSGPIPRLYFPDIPIAQIAMADGQLVYHLLANGTAYRQILGGNPRNPSSKLDGIVKIAAQDIAGKSSKRMIFLRSDGSLWIAPFSFADGSFDWVAPDNSFQVTGIDHARDFALFSERGRSDTVVALKEDGTVAYWGAPTTDEDARAKQDGYMMDVAYAAPDVRQLALPGHTFVKVAAARSVGGALDTDGHVWVWGDSALRGGLGGSDRGPMRIEGLPEAADILFGWGIALALCRDGTLWGWTDDLPPRKLIEHVRLP